MEVTKIHNNTWRLLNSLCNAISRHKGLVMLWHRVKAMPSNSSVKLWGIMNSLPDLTFGSFSNSSNRLVRFTSVTTAQLFASRFLHGLLPYGLGNVGPQSLAWAHGYWPCQVIPPAVLPFGIRQVLVVSRAQGLEQIMLELANVLAVYAVVHSYVYSWWSWPLG